MKFLIKPIVFSCIKASIMSFGVVLANHYAQNDPELLKIVGIHSTLGFLLDCLTGLVICMAFAFQIMPGHPEPELKSEESISILTPEHI